MKLFKLMIPATLFLLIFASCQYENAEEYYRSHQNINPTDTTQNDSVSVAKKLLLHIPFNSTIEDESDDEIVVVTHGSPGLTYDRFNQPNQALYLDGENQYVEMDLGEQDSIAVSFWFNCASGKVTSLLCSIMVLMP